MKKINPVLKIIIVSICLYSCTLTVNTITKKKELTHIFNNTQLSDFANNYFWEHFHQGNYDKLDSILFYLYAAYNENTNHLETNSHLGFAHAWALSERNRVEQLSPLIIQHATLATQHFGEAYKLNSKDPRLLGFLADFKMNLGAISKDKGLTTEGYFDGQKSIKQWSTFNYFTIGYVLSDLDHESWQFKKALEWQWKTLDKCLCEKVDRESFDFSQYIDLEAKERNIKRKRACWNSWIAPHNIEGFFLNMGDMLVKSGDWKKGIEIYKQIKSIPQYETWVHQEFLEKRIQNAEANVELFRGNYPKGAQQTNDNQMLINTPVSCMICHQKSTKDLELHQNINRKEYFKEMNVYFLDKKKVY